VGADLEVGWPVVGAVAVVDGQAAAGVDGLELGAAVWLGW
jgi:hypothetical protein